MTHDLRRVLEAQHAVADGLRREREPMARWVFCYITGTKACQCMTGSGLANAWRRACLAADHRGERTRGQELV